MFQRIIIVFLMVLPVYGGAQEDAWVYFTDKADVASSLANPISILTQKAIDRKQKFNIPIDERDVPVNETYIADLKLQTGITVMAKSKWFNAVHVRGSETNISALSSLSYVDAIDFANNSLNANTSSRRSKFKNRHKETTTDFTYGNTQNQVEMINADALHSEGFTGEGITIAVMDSGFPNVNTMGAFQRLRDNGDLLGGYDFVNRNDDVYASTTSQHGTLVLSTMAGYIENDYVGTAPDASYYLFLTEDVSSENPVEESNWVEAVERADSLGVDMINTSLGYTTFDNSSYDYIPSQMNGQVTFISKGASIASDKGLLLVISAGNSGNGSWQTVSAPADSPDVLSVGAVDANGNYAFFSSRGGSAQVGYQKPDVVAHGQQASVVTQNNTITTASGTSFSSPIMCGGIASLWQAYPNLSANEIKDVVRQSASQFSTPNDFLGYGIPDLGETFNILSTNDFQNEVIAIYPNPFHQNLNISTFSDEPFQVTFINVLGQQVISDVFYAITNSIDTSLLKKGIYFVELRSANTSRTYKLIKR